MSYCFFAIVTDRNARYISALEYIVALETVMNVKLCVF